MNWILLRGLSRQAEHWGSFPQSLRTASNDMVIALDLPGFGKESHVSFSFSLQKNIDFLRSKCMPLLNTKKSSIIGLSFGGMLALEWLKLYPEDFSMGVIINSSASDICRVSERISKMGIYTIVRYLFSNTRKDKERQILNLTSNVHALNEMILQSWIQLEDQYPIKRLAVLKQLLVSGFFKAPSDLGVPLLFLGALNDRLVQSNCTLKLAEFYKSEVFLHPTAGHDLPLDAPEWVIQQILEFRNQCLKPSFSM
jgi:pimeloyl-ACP methyl ester carboxylesterase